MVQYENDQTLKLKENVKGMITILSPGSVSEPSLMISEPLRVLNKFKDDPDLAKNALRRLRFAAETQDFEDAITATIIYASPLGKNVRFNYRNML